MKAPQRKYDDRKNPKKNNKIIREAVRQYRAANGLVMKCQ